MLFSIIASENILKKNARCDPEALYSDALYSDGFKKNGL